MNNTNDWQVDLQSVKYYGFKAGVRVLGSKRSMVKLVFGDKAIRVPLQEAIKEIDRLRTGK